jgi:hypothetical protein
MPSHHHNSQPTDVTAQQSLKPAEEALERGKALPGVDDLLRVYGQYAQVIDVAAAYARTGMILRTSTAGTSTL